MAYLLFMEHHILPDEFAAFPPQVKAFIYACYAKHKEDTDNAKEEARKNMQ